MAKKSGIGGNIKTSFGKKKSHIGGKKSKGPKEAASKPYRGQGK